MTRTEVLRIQKYLNSKFDNTKFTLKNSPAADDSMEVYQELDSQNNLPMDAKIRKI